MRCLPLRWLFWSSGLLPSALGSVSVRLQSIWHKHEQEHKNRPSETRKALGRAIEDELLEDPQVDRKDILASQMAAALREEMAMDAKGRRYRVNHAVRITRAGVQYTFWASMALHPTTPPPSLPLKIKTETLPRLGNPCGN